MNIFLHHGYAAVIFGWITLCLAVTPLSAQEVFEEEGPLPPLVSSEETVNQRLFMEGFKAMALEEYDLALAKYSELLGRDPGNHVAHFEMAKAFYYTEQTERALEAILRAIRLDGNNVWYRLLATELLADEERFAEAAAQMEQVIKLEPGHPDYYFELAYLHIMNRKFEEAIATYELLQSKIGIYEDIAVRKYRLLLEMNHWTEAEQVLLELRDAYPSEISVYHHLANFYMQKGDKQNAMETFRTILELDPNDPMAQLGMAESYKANRDFTAYLKAVRPLMANPEVDIDLKVSEIMPFLRTVDGTSDEELRKAMLEVGRLLTEAHDTDAKAFAVYGDMLYNVGQPEKALEQFEKALALNPAVFAVWEQALMIAAQTGNGDKLITLSAHAIDLYPNQAFFFFMNGVGHSMEGNFREAEYSLNDALMMAGRNETLRQQIQSQLGTVYFRLGEYPQSDAAFEKALEMNPRDAISLNNYSYYLAVRGVKLEQAKAMSAKSNELLPGRAAFQDTYGYILFRMELYSESAEWFEKALHNSGSSDPEILEHYGDALFMLNRTDEALKYWEKALDLGGNGALRKKVETKSIKGS